MMQVAQMRMTKAELISRLAHGGGDASVMVPPPRKGKTKQARALGKLGHAAEHLANSRFFEVDANEEERSRRQAGHLLRRASHAVLAEWLGRWAAECLGPGTN